MSRIRRLSYAISDKGRRATPIQQAARMRDSVLALLEQVNQNAQASRRITKKSAFTVVLRSLQSTRNLPFSLREHMALKELSQYINLAQSNKVNSLTLSHTDLLPISHPRSTRDHSLTASALREARNRWIADDSRITDEKARTILASALNAEVDSVEHTYFLAMLSALPQGTIPGEVLIAAVGDGNSPLARSLRAQLQRRDRKGRFAYQGGGIRALVRRGGKVFSLVGRTLMDAPDGKVLMELPDGRIAKVTPEKGEYVKAILNPTKDGYSEKPVRTSVTDEVIDEADLEFVDSPEGWNKEQENFWRNVEDPRWVVEKSKDGKLAARKELWDKNNPEAEQVFQAARGDNWADILDDIDRIENTVAKPVSKEEIDRLQEKSDENFKKIQKEWDEQKAKIDIPDTNVRILDKKLKGLNYPDGAFKLRLGEEYDPQGRVDSDAPKDFTDDPVEIAQNFDARDIRQALEEAIIPQGENENAFGVGSLEFNDGTGLVDAGALYNALKEAGEDADLELARIYDKANGNDNNEKALLDSRKGEEQVGQSTPDIAEAFERVTEEGTPDVAPAAETPEFVEEKRDEAPLPPLLKGLTENELARFMESKDHTPHLPKNKDLNVPEGYNKLDPSPFNNWREVTPDNPDPVLPEGFSDNPVFLAQNVSEDELKKELRRAVEPGNEAPGYGAIKLETEDGEEFVANVPGEAIRDALQLQGVDTDEELNKIYTEGRPAQKQGMDDSEAGRIIAEIEKEDGPDAFEQIAGQPFIPKGIVQPLPEFKRDPEEPVDMGGLGIKVGDRVLHRGKYKTVKEVRGEGLDRTVYFEEEYPGENNWLTVGIKQQSVKRLPENAAPETVDVLGEKVIKDPIGLGDWNLDNFVLRKVFGKWTVRDKNGREKFGKYDTMEDAVAAIQERRGKKPTPTPAQPQAAERKPGTATEGETNLDVKAMLDEEEKLADKFQDEEDMVRGDAQAAAEAEMKRKYGKTAIEALNELSREEALRILDEREKDIRGEGLVSVPENKNIRPAAPEDFEVDGLQEIPNGLEEYPAAANVAPAPAGPGGPPPSDGGEGGGGPYRITVKVVDLKPGDITVGDHFVITEIGEKVPGTDRVKIKGYYPGHIEQDTKQWNEWREIEVIRGAEAPEKGDLPVLSKPKEKEFGRRKKNDDGTWGFANPEDQARFDAAMAEYNIQLDAAKKRWADPTEPTNQPHRAIVRAADLKPGDISTDPKKGNFVIERTFVDENTKPGFISVEGYYPGHVTQRKEWKVDTPIDVIRNVEAPAKGDLPELHQPHKIVNGKWIPDKDKEKRAEWQKKIDEAAARWQVPADLPVVASKENKPEEDKDIPNAVAIKKPGAPRQVAMPAFQGRMAEIAREAGGDWAKFEQLLADETLIFFDFETTGINDADGNEPWQVAAIKVRGGKVVDRINIAMNPGRSIKDAWAGKLNDEGKPNAVDLDGNPLTDEYLEKQISQAEGMKQLFDWAGPDGLFVAYNMAFDDEVARRMADKHGLDYAPAGLMDILPMQKDMFKDEENKPAGNRLGDVAAFLDVNLENWHAADADAEALAEIFQKLVDLGKQKGLGKDLFDVDARNDEYIKKLDVYNERFAKYQEELANYHAAKALQDALAGKEVNADDVIKAATAKPQPENVNMGQVGNEAEPIVEKPEVVVLDFTPNVDFPRGKMILKDRDWALDDKNTVLLPRENIRMRDLLPGDFMQSKDGNIVWQVVAVRGGEEFGLAPGKVRVYRKNVDTGELSTYEHFHGVFLDGVRRPINPRDLDAPATVAPEDGVPVIANEKENVANIEEKSVAGDVVFRKSVDIGGFADGYIRIKKNKEGRYEVLVGIVDNNDEALLAFNNNYRTYEAAVAEAEAVLKERADELLAEKRQGMAEPEEARAKDVPVSRGDLPANANDAPQIIEVENLPADIVGKVKIEDIGEDKPEYKSDAVVHDAEGDLVAHQSTRHGNKSAAEKEGRDFVNRVADSIQNPEKPAEEPKPKKPLSEKEQKALEEKEAIEKDNAWVEDNAGIQEGVYPGEMKPGEHFLWNAFFGQYEEILDVTYVGFLNRYRITVQNRVTGEKETRYYEADTPIRNVRLLGAQDDEFERVDKKGGTNRGARRGLIKRLPLDERVVAKTGRPVGGMFEKEGFYKDANGVSIKPGDVVIDPKKPELGRGVVKRREGAQVEEGKRAGGIGRKGVMYLDYVMVQFENDEERSYAHPGLKRKAKNLVVLNEIEEPINLPDIFQGGRAVPNIAPKQPIQKAKENQEVKDEAPVNVEQQEPAKAQGQGIRALVDRKLGRDKEEDLREQIEQAIADGDAIAFRYNGKVRNFTPKRIWTNPQNGNINVGGFESGQMKNFTIQKMDFMPTDENGLVQDMPAEVPAPEKINENAKLDKFRDNFANKFDNLENRSDIVAGFDDIANALPKAKNYKAPRNLRSAREAIDEINSSLARGAGVDEISEYYLDAAVRRLRRESGDSLAQDMADKLEKLSNEIKAKRQELVDKRLNAPLPEMPQAEGIDKDNLKNALNEIIQRLPEYGAARGQSNNDKDAGIQRDKLRKYLKSLDQNFFDLDELTHADLKEVADKLRVVADKESQDNNAVKAEKYKNFADLLDGYHKELESKVNADAPVVKEPLNKLDPEEVAKQRIADRANEFAASEKLQAFMANDLNVDNEPLLQPFKDELQEFFANGEPRPLAMLSPAARQALGFFIGKELKSPNKSIDPDMNEDVINNLGDLAFQLHAERLAFTPNATDLGVGEVLLDMDFDKIKEFGDFLFKNDIERDVKLKINGQDTGFNIKVARGEDKGVNTTYFITHRATGRKFVMKLDTMVGERGADAEIASAALNRALGNVGAYQVFRHRKRRDVVVTSWAGEMIDFDAEPKRIGDTKYIRDHEAAAMNGAFVDVIGLAVMDAILVNGDRHRNNLLVGKVKNLDGVNPTDDAEAVQFMAVDHGLAGVIVGGRRMSPDDYIDGADSDDSHRRAINIAARLVEKIGVDLYKRINDMTVQQAIQALKRERGGDINDADLDLLIQRLELLRGIDISKWKKILKKR